jgi:hypothetical protein
MAFANLCASVVLTDGASKDLGQSSRVIHAMTGKYKFILVTKYCYMERKMCRGMKGGTWYLSIQSEGRFRLVVAYEVISN